MSGAAGSVHLVGAGPGNPALLTLRGDLLLRRADVILFDRLVDPAMLEVTRPDALRIDVGKPRAASASERTLSSERPGTSVGPGRDAADETLSQRAIEALLVEHARRGAVVVRLKGGDPFVFGRGYEELLACRRAGVPCEVVPGISSAIAGPGAAGIPVTARGVARSFAVVTARAGEGESPIGIDYDALARLETIVVLMGRERLAELAGGLVRAGLSEATPAAIIERATWPTQRRVVATLGTIAAAADERELAPPCVLVVGATAALGEMDAHGPSAAPLAGRRILVTRPRSASAVLVQELRARGAETIECPLIRIEITPAAIPASLERFDWIVVTSLHGARGLAASLVAADLDGRALAGTRIAAVGPRTAAELWDALRLRADLVPDEHRAAALIAAMTRGTERSADAPAQRVLFACGTLARDEITAGLRGHGFEVDELVVYRTCMESPGAEVRRAVTGGLDAVLLYSPSAARSLAEHALDVGAAPLLCVGPTTAIAAAELFGTRNRILVPQRYGDEGVIALLEELFGVSGPTGPTGPTGSWPAAQRLIGGRA